MSQGSLSGDTAVRVLIVDDEADWLELATLLLERSGMEVRTAGSAAAALKMLGEYDAQVLVSDLGMPFEDGFQLMREIRALGSPQSCLGAIALTAFPPEGHLPQAMAAGFDEYLRKPIGALDLTSAIERVLPLTYKRADEGMPCLSHSAVRTPS